MSYIDTQGLFFFLIPGIPAAAAAIGDAALIGSLWWGLHNSSSDDSGDSYTFPPGSQSTPAPLPPDDDGDGPEQCRTADLTPTHSQTMSNNQLRKLIKDIQQNGIQRPISYIERNGTKYVVDGHHRLIAAKKLGMKNVPVQRVQLPYQGYRVPTDLDFTP